jgi:hypothetical protein
MVTLQFSQSPSTRNSVHMTGARSVVDRRQNQMFAYMKNYSVATYNFLTISNENAVIYIYIYITVLLI